MNGAFPSLTRRAGSTTLVAALALVASGCLGEPPVEKRLTRLEILNATPTDGALFAVGSDTTVQMRVRITYREILTGRVVGELRASDMFTVDDTCFEQSERWVEKTQDVDRILQNSVSLGFDEVLVTGWDHLVQELDLTFDGGQIRADREGETPPVGGTPHLFLLLYFSTEFEEIEDEDGEEILFVTPLRSEDHPILYSGIELGAGTAGGGE